jgi:hypothetical protein
VSNLPADVANEALLACGYDFVIGDLQEGTRPAQILLQKYGQCLRQLLRAANWNFCRKQTPLELLADATGQTLNVGQNVMRPWLYAYAYPIDAARVRFIPANPGNLTTPIPAGNIVPPTAGATTQVGGLGNPFAGGWLIPSRWMESFDPNFPAQSGSQFWETQGQAPTGSLVILTNVKNATAVYSGLITYPSVWDSMFRAAFVAYLASEVAFALWATKSDKMAQFGMQVRRDQMAIAKDKIISARAADGNEGWHNSDFDADWMRFRRTGGGTHWGAGSGGPGGVDGAGYFYSGCDDCCGAGNTSAY